PIGGKSSFVLSTLNTSTLTAYYTSGVSLDRSVLVGALRSAGIGAESKLDPAVIPPWEIPSEAPEDELLQRVFAADPIIDTADPLVQGGDNEELTELFTLWRGLSRLSEVADYAETGRLADFHRASLESRFDGYLSEIIGYADELSFVDVTLLSGNTEATIASSQVTPKAIEKTLPQHIGAILTSNRGDAIPGLTGTETFTIDVTTSTRTTNVAIDLADIAGTLDVDNVTDHLNTKMEAAGVTTRFGVQRTNEFAYGLRIELNSSETISFTAGAATQSPAVYVAGSAASTDGGLGFLAKLDDLSAAAPSDVFRSETDTTAADDARGVAVDSLGNVFVVGATSGDLDGLVNQETQDLYLRKYDASGELVWSRLLGSATSAAGFAVAVDGSDNVIVAGETQDRLTDTAYGGNFDSFVTQFDTDGNEVWTRQAAPYASDGALALTVDASDNVFIAGYTNGAISTDLTSAGGSDAYLTKLDSSGSLVYNKQFGSTTGDRATAVTVDNAGNVFVAAESGGNVVVRKYADSDASQTPIWEVDLGSLGSGAVTGLALGGSGDVYVAGYTDNASLSGTIVQAHAGDSDGFVSRITDSGASGAVDITSYLGTAAADSVGGLTVYDNAGSDEIYLAGSTEGTLGGEALVGTTDAFAAKLDATGATQWVQHMGGAYRHSGNAIAFDATGTSVITRLGLSTTPVPAEPAELITSLTSARAGQWFEVSVNGNLFERVTLEDDDTYANLTFKMSQILDQYGSAHNESGVDGLSFEIGAQRGGRIEIRAGADGEDLLAPLGLREAMLIDSDSVEGKEANQDVFALGLFDSLSVSDKQSAADSSLVIDNAMREIRDVYKRLIGEEEVDNLALLAAQQLTPEQSAKLNSMRFALDRLSQVAASAGQSFDLLI
ncbi:MAG: SBBP repeat-containing protein, partial [Alphaproteobacteria bacterium]|nr:SBBP repeat-containing protein [Alphaproteobacteria bacterium]